MLYGKWTKNVKLVSTFLGIPSGHRSPALEPITEGKPTQDIQKVPVSCTATPNILSKVPSNEKIYQNKSPKPIIKVSSPTEDLLDIKQLIPPCRTYENLDFLKNDNIFSKDSQKPVCVKNLTTSTLKSMDKPQLMQPNSNENNLKVRSFNVNLRTVPKNFTRNRFIRDFEDTGQKHNLLAKQSNLNAPNHSVKVSNLTLGSMKSASSPVTEKFVNSTSRGNYKSDLVSSSLVFEACKAPPEQTQIKTFLPRTVPERCSLSRRRYCRDTEESPVPKRTPLLQRKTSSKFITESETPLQKDEETGILAKVLRRTPIFERKSFKPQIEPPAVKQDDCRNYVNPPSTSGFRGSGTSIVRNIVDSLNRKSGGMSFGNRGGYGRSSLKVVGSPKVNLKGVVRGNLDTEFTPL